MCCRRVALTCFTAQRIDRPQFVMDPTYIHPVCAALDRISLSRDELQSFLSKVLALGLHGFCTLQGDLLAHLTGAAVPVRATAQHNGSIIPCIVARRITALGPGVDVQSLLGTFAAMSRHCNSLAQFPNCCFSLNVQILQEHAPYWWSMYLKN